MEASTASPPARARRRSPWTLLLSSLIVVLVVLVAFGYSPVRELLALQHETDSRWAELYERCQHRAENARGLVPLVSAAEDLDPQLVGNLTAAQAGLEQCHVNPIHAPRESAEYVVFAQRQSALYKAVSGVLNASLRNPKLKTDSQFKDLLAQLLLVSNELAVRRGRFIQAGIAYNNRLRRPRTRAFGMLFGFRPRLYLEQSAGSPTESF